MSPPPPTPPDVLNEQQQNDILPPSHVLNMNCRELTEVKRPQTRFGIRLSRLHVRGVSVHVRVSWKKPSRGPTDPNDPEWCV